MENSKPYDLLFSYNNQKEPQNQKLRLNK